MKPNLVEKISLLQLYIIIILFQIGSSVVVGIAMEAKQDAWLAVFIATAIGVGIVCMYLYILSLQQGKNLFEIMELTIGRLITIGLAFLYCTYFFYIASRVLRDFLDLLKTVIYPNTPIEILAIIFMIVIVYIVYLGPEVLGRCTETFLPYIGFFLLAIAFFLFAGGDINLSNLKPFLAEGFGPIWKAIFPGLLTFPFGEAIVLTMFMTLATNQKKMPFVSIFAVITSGIILALFKTIKVAVLGVNTISRATFPLLMAAREISYANFIERIDALIIFVMMLGILVKVSVFFYGGLKGLEFIFDIPYRYFSIPMGLFISITSIFIAANFAEHMQEGIQLVPLFIHIPLQLVIPFILAVIIFFRKLKKKGGKQEHAKKTV